MKEIYHYLHSWEIKQKKKNKKKQKTKKNKQNKQISNFHKWSPIPLFNIYSFI